MLVLPTSFAIGQLLGNIVLINGIVLTGILFLVGLIKIFFFEESIKNFISLLKKQNNT
ncbi:MAG: hypothetical protein ACOCRX_08125 [Candidatus Woesearchaeota archaeon]